MSSCKVCHLDSKKHSKKLWKLHQETQICAFCSRSSSEHSEKLWRMHNLAIEKSRAKGEKLYPITLGFARTCVARVVRINADPPNDVEFVPIYMACTECGLSLGSVEEDYADMLDGMCLGCFRKLIGQTDILYDKPPATKIIKEGVKTRMYRDSKGTLHKLYGNFTNANHCGEDSH